MAFPVVAARSSGNGDTPATVTLPTGIVANDLLVAVVSSDGIPTLTDATGTWTKLGQASYATASTPTQAVFYKTAAGGDTLQITGSVVESTSYECFRITGSSGTVTGSSATGDSTNSDPPSHTPAGGAKDFLWIVTRTGDNIVAATAAPTGFSNLQTSAAAGTAGAATNTAELQLNAATVDPGTWTVATEQWVCWTLAVAPVAGATVPTGWDEVRLFTR